MPVASADGRANFCSSRSRSLVGCGHPTGPDGAVRRAAAVLADRSRGHPGVQIAHHVGRPVTNGGSARRQIAAAAGARRPSGGGARALCAKALVSMSVPVGPSLLSPSPRRRSQARHCPTRAPSGIRSSRDPDRGDRSRRRVRASKGPSRGSSAERSDRPGPRCVGHRRCSRSRRVSMRCGERRFTAC